MENRIFLLFIIPGFVFLSGCTQQTQDYTKDCGEDETCFKEAGKTCSKVTLTSNEPSVGMIFEINILGEVNGQCQVLVKNIESSQIPTLEGKEAVCATSKTSIYEEGTDSVNLLRHGDKCQGELIDATKELFLTIAEEMGGK